jgi:predicted nucleic acid-binding protein
MKAVVSDSTVLIGLAKIDFLFLLKEMFQEIHVPEAVFREVTQDGGLKPGAEAVRNASWILRQEIKDRTQARFLMTVLEEGEAEVLVLAKELQADLILLDEEKARKSATRAGFSVMGVIGILIAAKRLGLITSVRSCIEKLQQEKFRLSERVVTMALQQAGELAR